MFRRLYFLILLNFVLSACSSPQPAWRKPGTSPNDTLTALSQCKYEIRLNNIPQAERDMMLKNCMQAQGFRLHSR